MEPRKVLFIDDNRDFVTLNCTMLEMHGYRTKSAYTGFDGIASAKAFQPDVVICDIGLPDIDGYQVARAIRNSEEIKDCFLVSLTGYAQPAEPPKEADFHLQIAKPIDIEKLISILETAKNIGAS